jgi:hypothetical protein
MLYLFALLLVEARLVAGNPISHRYTNSSTVDGPLRFNADGTFQISIFGMFDRSLTRFAWLT